MSLPVQQLSYSVDESTAAEQMDFLQRISNVMKQYPPPNGWKPLAPLMICLCGMQSTGKSCILEYLLRVDGVAFKRGGVGTKRPIVYIVRSSKDGSTETTFEIQNTNGEYRTVTKDGFMAELAKANKKFTKEEFRVRITTPSGFDVVLVDLPGFQAEPVDPGKPSTNYETALYDYQTIRDINMSYLSNNDALIVYVRRASDWETDEDSGFKLVCNEIDKDLKRTVVVTNWAESHFLQFNDSESAEAFLTARKHTNQNVKSHVPLFFLDFEMQNNPNGTPGQIPVPIPASNVRTFLEQCQDRHFAALHRGHPELAESYKKTLGTLRLGDYLRFVVLRNFRRIAEKASRLLTEQEAKLQARISAFQRGFDLDDARERYILMLSGALKDVMEKNVMPRNMTPFLVPLDDFPEPWPSQESENAVRKAINEIVTRDGGKRAGGALWLEFVENLLPTAITAIKPHLMTYDERANLIGAILAVAPADPLTTALVHSKIRAVDMLDKTIDHILHQAAFILSEVYRTANELVHETIRRFSHGKHSALRTLYDEPEFLDAFMDYLDEAFHAFMEEAKSRTRHSLCGYVRSLCHPSPGILPTRQGMYRDGATVKCPFDSEEKKGDSDSITVTDESVDFYSNSPEEQAASIITALQSWSRAQFATTAVGFLGSDMVSALTDASDDNSFVLHMKRPHPDNEEAESVRLQLLQAHINATMDQELELRKTAYESVKRTRKDLVTFLTTGRIRHHSQHNQADLHYPSRVDDDSSI